MRVSSCLRPQLLCTMTRVVVLFATLVVVLMIYDSMNHTNLSPDSSLTSAALSLNHLHEPTTDHRATILPHFEFCPELHHHHPLLPTPPCSSHSRLDPHHQQPALWIQSAP
ncbi:hypothetical protein D8674_028653 [Pyrus ussuriensis x Pyrus communis]|uniref:Uncharacterized protein n=1 Tax=Pyrus ussuriensis x Pyrus communis TaxID=2448454 RepID=A0A5N5HWW6_9ROSA|nr:hypothetical protein D8674_028653 [Pyrus ussuriensis x Pyrus communis]